MKSLRLTATSLTLYFIMMISSSYAFASTVTISGQVRSDIGDSYSLIYNDSNDDGVLSNYELVDFSYEALVSGVTYSAGIDDFLSNDISWNYTADEITFGSNSVLSFLANGHQIGFQTFGVNASILNFYGSCLLSCGSQVSLSSLDVSVSPVPVPAAAWLFGSALLGFFGFSRRKANA